MVPSMRMCLRATQRAGYEAAWTVNEAPLTAEFNENQTLLTLPREVMNREDSLEDFRLESGKRPFVVVSDDPTAKTHPLISPTEIRVVLGEDVQTRLGDHVAGAEA